MTYNNKNNLLGWMVFFIALTVYLLTAERYFSFWDCGEYISSAVKLQVTHSPGASLFQLLGAFFSIFSFENKKLYSLIINAMSGVFSAFTILFLFWTLTSLVKNYFLSQKKAIESLTESEMIIVFGSGLVGALTFTFSDTFWFSAVEGEVYSMATLFTSILIWLICKWENRADKPYSNKWFLLISFVIGLSIGVHLMVLLAVPAVCFIYYSKKYKLTTQFFLIANAITLGILIFVFKLIFPFVMTFFGKTEIFFVNQIGLPFNGGTIIAGILIILFFFFTINYTHNKNYGFLNLAILCLLFMLIGFSSWLMIPIRANANPPMNLNNPNNAIGLLDYYNREQYGEWPTIYGANYTAYIDQNGIESVENKGFIYEKSEEKGKYIPVSNRLEYKFAKEHISFFPRMYSPDPSNIKNYKAIAGTTENYKTTDPDSGEEVIRYKKPTFLQNFYYFIDYQVSYMFTRYLLWNFVGKQNDLEGNLEITKGNWESGISFLDKIKDKTLYPNKYTNKGTNHYYFLPFILGLFGFFFHLNRDFKKFYAILSLFLLTGLGIILYTSVKPFEPRERDYAVVSSFYAFSIWVGIGVLSIYSFLKIKNKNISYAIVLLGLCIPLLMAFENWDDHDRSKRRAAYDFAVNFLKPLDKNAILFVYGDNDTYPVWALQETEKYRSDLKIVNTTLLATAWNIEQVQRKTYNAMPLPSNLTKNEYREGTNENIKIISKEQLAYIITELPKSQSIPTHYFNYVSEFLKKDSISVQEAMQFIRKKDIGKDIIKAVIFENGEESDKENFLPSNKFYLKVNKENVLKHKLVKPSDVNKLVDYISLEYGANSISKNNFVFLAMLANYKWDRSIYFSGGGMYDEENIFYLQNYLQNEGLAYKFVPIKTITSESEDYGRVDTEVLYRIIKNFKWSNFNHPKAYFDETSLRNIGSYRNTVTIASTNLIKEGKNNKAKEVMELLLNKIPPSLHGYSISVAEIAHNFILIGEEKKALELVKQYKNNLKKEILFYNSLNKNQRISINQDTKRSGLEYATVVQFISSAYTKTGQNKKGFSFLQKSFTELEGNYFKLVEKLNTSTREDQVEMQDMVEVYTSAFKLMLENAEEFSTEFSTDKKRKLFSPLIELEE